MMNIENRWREYEAGKLTPPCVVQHDLENGKHLVWVWDGESIVGPTEMHQYSETHCLSTCMARKAEKAQIVNEPADPRDTKIQILEAKIVQLEKAQAAKTEVSK